MTEEHPASFWEHANNIIDQALVEDHVSSDVTTHALIPDHFEGSAVIIVKADGVLAGVEVAKAVFMHVDPKLIVDINIADGNRIKKGDVVVTVFGELASILKAERLALNFLCRLSGIATETSRFVKAVAGLDTKITDTRKTVPGLRTLEKYAVRMGGGQSHRGHLGEWILIKDNHLVALSCLDLGVRDAVRIARAGSLTAGVTKVEIEVESVEQAAEALEAGADIIMLDNMSLREMKHAVEMCRGRAIVEASGGITLKNVRRVAETGVDLISVGALTHSASALDMSLKIKTC